MTASGVAGAKGWIVLDRAAGLKGGMICAGVVFVVFKLRLGNEVSGSVPIPVEKCKGVFS